MKVPFSRLGSTIFGSHALHAFCTSVPVPVASKEVVGVAIMHLVRGPPIFSENRNDADSVEIGYL